MTILLSGTPAAAISNTEELGYLLVEVVKSPVQVVYSSSVIQVVVNYEPTTNILFTHGCRIECCTCKEC